MRGVTLLKNNSSFWPICKLHVVILVNFLYFVYFCPVFSHVFSFSLSILFWCFLFWCFHFCFTFLGRGRRLELHPCTSKNAPAHSLVPPPLKIVFFGSFISPTTCMPPPGQPHKNDTTQCNTAILIKLIDFLDTYTTGVWFINKLTECFKTWYKTKYHSQDIIIESWWRHDDQLQNSGIAMQGLRGAVAPLQ